MPSLLELIAVALGLTAMAFVILGVIVFREAPHALLNRIFLGATINTGLWTFAVFMITIENDYDGLLFWIRVAHVVAATIPCFVIALVYALQGEKEYPYKKVLAVCLFGLIMAGMSLTPTVIQGVAFPFEKKDVIYGSLFFLFPLFFGATISFALYKLFRLLRSSRGLVRYQIRYFLGGILVSFVIASLVNVFLPWIEITTAAIRSLGPLSILVAVTFIAYAIVRYRLMDIHLVLRRVVAYALTIALLTGMHASLVFSLEMFFGARIDSLFFFCYTIFLILTVAVLFQPLKNKLQFGIGHYFYRGVYDYFDTLIEANEAMLSILHRDELLEFLANKVVEAMHLTGATFFLKNPDGSFIAVAERYWQHFPAEETAKSLAPGNALLSFLEREGGVLLWTDLRGVVPREKGTLLATEMTELRAEAAVPVVVEGKLEGVFCLGAKLSGEPYSREDVKLLSTLASQVAVSLKNAQLYQEVLTIKGYLENVLVNMGNGLIAVDIHGRIATFNSAAERLTGYKAEEALSKKVEEVLTRRLSTPLLQTMNDGQGRNEIEVEMPIGAPARFLCYSTAVIDLPETKEHGAIMVLSDVTRIKVLEKEKSQVQRLVSLREMAAGMAHEIKNPLVSIKTFAELLPKKYEDHEFRYTFSRIVSQEIDRINNLIVKLLDFDNDSQDHCEAVDVKALMAEVILLLSPQLKVQEIRIREHYDPEIPPVWAGRDQLKQAILNVCLNGIQAMPEGGELRVGVFIVSTAGGGNNDVVPPEGKIRILVEDTGVGISIQQKERVFDPFFTTKAEGVGIGLSISQKIIVSYGGTIQFQSRDGEGTSFEICLPAVGQ
jgi:PAS domain S-box-containing protein